MSGVGALDDSRVRAVSLVATAVLVVAMITLLMRHALLAATPIAAGVQVIAALLMLWARLTFGARSFHAGADPTAGGLVSTGPYHLIRHPIYTAILAFTWAGVASHASAVGVALATVATAMLAVRMWAEERLLMRRLPGYPEYAARTRRVLPFVL